MRPALPYRAMYGSGSLGQKGSVLKPATIIGMLFVLVAMVVYSIGVWGAFRRRSFTRTHLTLLAVGLVFDIGATVAMSSTIGWTLDLRPGPPLLHTVLALVAFFGMLAGTVAAYVSFRRTDTGSMKSVTRWIVAPWVLWAFMFVWGSTRIGLK